MPRYFFDVINSLGTAEDEEGAELPNERAARSYALDSIRSIIAAEARGGVIDLRGRIDVRAESGDASSVPFDEAVEVLTGDAPAAAGEAGPRG